MTTIEPRSLNFFYEPADRLRLTVGEDRSYPTVKPAWSSPLSYPGRFLALLDGKGQEIVTLDDPNVLPPESLAAVMEEVRRRYLTSTVQAITNAKGEFGATYWHVETERGPRDFVTQSLQENVQWLSAHHLLLTDVDGNRFEIPDVTALDSKSRGFLDRIL
jgi:hypothetical protein